MTSMPEYHEPPPAWGPPQQQRPMYYPQQPPSPAADSKQREPESTTFMLGAPTKTLIGVAAAAAAAAACVAPFLRFWVQNYSETQPGPRNVRLIISGFGHSTYHGVAAVATQTHGHDTNYGVPLITSAIVLGIAALMLVARKGNAVLPLVLAAIGGSMLAAVAVEGAMDRAARSSFDSGYSQWSVGYGWWSMVFSGGLGAIVAVLSTALVVTSSRALSTVEVQRSAELERDNGTGRDHN